MFPSKSVKDIEGSIDLHTDMEDNLFEPTWFQPIFRKKSYLSLGLSTSFYLSITSPLVSSQMGVQEDHMFPPAPFPYHCCSKPYLFLPARVLPYLER